MADRLPLVLVNGRKAELPDADDLPLSVLSAGGGSDGDFLQLAGGLWVPVSTLAIAQGGTGGGTEAEARNNLGLEIGADVQAHDVLLDSIAALAFAGNGGKALMVNSGATAFEFDDAGGGGWEDIASATPTGTNVVDFNDIPPGYRDFRLFAHGLSSTLSTSFGVRLSSDGSTYTSSRWDFSFSISAQVWSIVYFYGVNRNFIYAVANGTTTSISDDTVTRPLSSQADQALFRCDGGVTDFRIEASAGNFDAGTIILEGRP